MCVINATTESRLWFEIDQGNSTSQEEIILGHRGIVFKLASRHRRNYDDMAELVGEGEVSLCEAALTYPEKERGCRFSTYAHLRVHASMIRFKRVDFEFSRSEWEGRKASESKRLITEEVDRLESEGKPPPAIRELADVCGDDAVSRWLEEREGVSTDHLHTQPVNGHRVDARRLPKPTQLVLQALSDGASVGEIADDWHPPRQEIYSHAVLGWTKVYGEHEGSSNEQVESLP